MVNSRKKKKATVVHESPEWSCEVGSLPEEPISQNLALPPVINTEQPSLSINPSQESEPQDDTSFNAKQSQNAKQPPWLAWQDQFLASEALKLRPFLEPHGKPAQEAWDRLADAMLTDSAQQGTAIERTGAACRARLKKLLDAHRREETRSLQKTGTDEEINGHVENMTELVALVDYDSTLKEAKSTSVKAKVDGEVQAALELRDAAMKGVVPRSTLTDITQVKGATSTIHEKQGQRAERKRAHSPGSKENLENLRPAAK